MTTPHVRDDDSIKTDEQPWFKQIELCRRKMTTTWGRFTRESLKLEVDDYDGPLGDMAARLTAEVLCQAVVTEKMLVLFYVPKTWWQHFKETYFHGWLKQRFPVRYREVQKSVKYGVRYEVYPTANLPCSRHHANGIVVPVAGESVPTGDAAAELLE